MIRFLAMLFVGGFLAGCAAQGSNVRYTPAGDQPNILIMSEDADPDTVPMVERVISALSEELNNEGFSVYDEVSATLGRFTQGWARRTDAEIIDIARSVKLIPIDVAAVFLIYPRVDDRGYGRKLHVRIEGRLLHVKSAQRLGNFEVETEAATFIPTDCDRNCELERVGSVAQGLARDLGAVLAKKLDWLSPASRSRVESSIVSKRKDQADGLSQAYVLKLSGFNNKEIDQIENRIVQFRGYEHHRPVSSLFRAHEYWYESSGGTAYIYQNLRHMLDELNVSGRIEFLGNSFSIQLIGRR